MTSAFFICGFAAVLAIPALEAAVPMTSGISVGLATEPGGLEAVAVSSTAIDLYWTDAQAVGAEMMAVIRGDDVVASVPSSSRFYHDTGLLSNSLYTYRIAPVVDGSPSEAQASAPVTEKTYPSWQDEARFDVIVVGGTASGVAAARAAAMFGAAVVLTEETNRLGGMSSNGLGRADIHDSGIRASGFFQRMRERVIAYYGQGNGLAFEPRVANAVVKSLLYEYPNITILRKVRVREVLKRDRCVIGVKVSPVNDDRIAPLYAPVVIDATIEGDVAVAAGCRSRVGREPRSRKEPHNGHIFYDNEADEILPGSTGKGDRKVQSYAYLMTVKDYGPGEDRSIPEPPGYDKNNYLYSPEWTETWAFTSGRLPNNKFEVNQHPWGTDLPGINYGYPEGSPKERAEIERSYKDHALGYLYYLQTEKCLRNIGLADDEYRDTGNWPPTLYVREARRIEGLRVMNEWDVWKACELVEPASVAVGDYPMDSHAVENPPGPNVRHRGEGEWWLVRYTPWYHVPLDIVVPRGVDGLLVSSAVSATHVAYGTLRMEPVRMSLGEAAGVTAYIAVSLGVRPAEVPPALVQEKLLSLGAYITWYRDVTPATSHFEAIQFMGVRGFFRDEEFKPDDMLMRAQALKWLSALAIAEGRRVTTFSTDPQSCTESVTRGEFALWLVEAFQAGAAAEAFMRAGDPDAAITRAEAAHGLYLAHRGYALGPRAFSERTKFVNEIEAGFLKS